MPGLSADGARRPRSRRGRSPRDVALGAVLASALAGPVVGLLWWLASPGGLRPAGATYLDLVQSLGGAVAVLALCCVAAGTVSGVVWVVARDDRHDARAVGRLVGLLVGGLVGAALAWGTGTTLRLLRPDTFAEVPADVVADLLSPRPGVGVLAALVLWPLATGLLVVVDTLRELAWEAVGRDGRPR